MSLTNILILSGVALLTGLSRDALWRKYLILGLSVYILYYLQPTLPIRFLGFWLSTSTLAIAILSWIFTRNSDIYSWKVIWTPGIVILGIIILISVSRYFGSIAFIIPAQPPQSVQVVIFILLILLVFFVSTKLPVSKNSYWLLFLIVIFVMIKTPVLSKSLSIFFRSINQQSTELASSVDIVWIGYSYIAFRIIHTIRDRQTGRLPDVELVDYLNYIIFFPTLIAGPIDRLDNFVRSIKFPLKDRFEIVRVGGKRIVIGLFKKFVIADSLALFALNNTNALQIQGTGWMWVCLYAYAFQIYFDFSGYTDIAIGMGRFMGFVLPENFLTPYLKPNLTQFWNNWHMTLTQWFRAYFFNPLTRYLRSRKKKWATFAMILVTQLSTMILIGLWHGVSWNFIMWGIWHGLGLFVHNRWSNFFNIRTQNWASTSRRRIILNGSGIFLTFNFVALGWVFFVTTSPWMSWQVLQKLIGGV